MVTVLVSLYGKGAKVFGNLFLTERMGVKALLLLMIGVSFGPWDLNCMLRWWLASEFPSWLVALWCWNWPDIPITDPQ